MNNKIIEELFKKNKTQKIIMSGIRPTLNTIKRIYFNKEELKKTYRKLNIPYSDTE